MAGHASPALPKKRTLPDFFEVAAPPKKSRLRQHEVVHREPGSETDSVDPDLHNFPIFISDDEDANEDDSDRLRRRVPSFRLAQSTNRNILEHCIVNGFRCAAGTTVELNDGDFLRIKTISEDIRRQVFVAGDHLVRTTAMKLKMPERINELVWKQQVSDYEVDASKVRGRREVIFTSRQYPLMSLETDRRRFPNQNEAMAIGPLFCRWKTISGYSGTARVSEHVIDHLRHDDADNEVRRSNSGDVVDARIDDALSRLIFRDAPIQDGGSHRVVHTQINDGGIQNGETRSYTFGDGFCGAGGASRGALDAGLVVKWGFDKDAKAMQTYRRNFSQGGTDCREETVNEFLSRVRAKPPFVDIMHLSPPCQPFSPAHTIASPVRDEINQAAMFSAWQMLKLIKPRIATVEETFGLESRHGPFFDALINIFTTQGYSIRWAILECQYYGVPQTRKRLVVIASAPGETLPPFPRPTHGSHGAALVTINDQIAHIPRGAPDHVFSFSSAFKVRTPYIGDTQAKTITCAGGERNHHPSGRRPYTIREAASLQTFPMQHSFGGGRNDRTAKKAQIGNAVPPAMAKALFKTIIKSLKETDGVA